MRQWFLMGKTKHSQNCQNSKFAMSLQRLEKEVRDEVNLLHVGKHQILLQVDINTLGTKVSYKVILSWLMVMTQITQSNKFARSQKKEVSHRSFY